MVAPCSIPLSAIVAVSINSVFKCINLCWSTGIACVRESLSLRSATYSLQRTWKEQLRPVRVTTVTRNGSVAIKYLGLNGSTKTYQSKVMYTYTIYTGRLLAYPESYRGGRLA